MESSGIAESASSKIAAKGAVSGIGYYRHKAPIRYPASALTRRSQRF
jgi:hypothetical protein